MSAADNPAFADAMRRGRAAAEDKRMDDALAGFAAASGLDPQAPEPAFARCLVLLRVADPQAGVVMQDLLARFPVNSAKHRGTQKTKVGSLRRQSFSQDALVCNTVRIPGIEMLLHVRHDGTCRSEATAVYQQEAVEHTLIIGLYPSSKSHLLQS